MTNQLEIIRYLWAGLRLNEKAVVAPNGNVVKGVRYSTLMDLQARGWIEPDPSRERHYRLTPEGRARALVKQRVEDFLTELTNQPTT